MQATPWRCCIGITTAPIAQVLSEPDCMCRGFADVATVCEAHGAACNIDNTYAMGAVVRLMPELDFSNPAIIGAWLHVQGLC